MTITTLIYKALYWYISTVDKNNEILFMNYGYHHDNESLPLSSQDEINRYSIQLYHRMAQLTDIANKNIVEVGCGRGGGLAYITRTFNPASALGIDLDAKAMHFATNHFNFPKLEFHQGNAMHLKLPDNSCDVLLNVESSHRYPLMGLFLDEVYRILRPGGYFLFTDFRPKHKFEAMKKMIAEKRFILKEEQIINKEVINALKLDTPRRVELVERYAPLFLKKYIHDFAGNIGSPTYKKINSGDFVYFVYCFQKPE